MTLRNLSLGERWGRLLLTWPRVLPIRPIRSTWWVRWAEVLTPAWIRPPSRSTWSKSGLPVRGDSRRWANRRGRPILKFSFARSVCAACPLFEACVRSQTNGRTVTTHAQERYLQAARQRQETPADRPGRVILRCLITLLKSQTRR